MPGRTSLEYIDGERSIDVEVEPGEGLAVYSRSIVNWDTSGETEPVTEDEKTRVMRNIAAALDFLEVSYILA